MFLIWCKANVILRVLRRTTFAHSKHRTQVLLLSSSGGQSCCCLSSCKLTIVRNRLLNFLNLVPSEHSPSDNVRIHVMVMLKNTECCDKPLNLAVNYHKARASMPVRKDRHPLLWWLTNSKMTSSPW